MSIYPSTRVLPYVYKLVHKETGQFYFGYRCANKSPSSNDLGIHYFTSSDQVKLLGFENFECEILAEFFDKQDAIDFENYMISEEWNNSLILNRGYGGAKFRNVEHSQDTKDKISAANKGRIVPAEENLRRSASLKGRVCSPETRQKLSAAGMGRKLPSRKMSDETKAKISHFRKNLTDEAKLKLSIAQTARYARSPMALETKQKISEANIKFAHQAKP